MLKNSRRVLLAEDNEDIIFLTRRAFRKLKVINPLEVVTSGREAIDFLAGLSPPDVPALILLDLKMPMMSGFDVLRWIRNREQLNRIPVVVLTASEDDKDINLAYELGANSYLIKPLMNDKLMDLLDRLSEYWLSFNSYPILELKLRDDTQ